MSQVSQTNTPDSSFEERQLGSISSQQLIAGSQVTNRGSEDDRKRKNFASVTFSLLSVIMAFGGIAIPRWSVLIASSGEHLGEYGLFIVKILQTDGINTTHAVYQDRKFILYIILREYLYRDSRNHKILFLINKRNIGKKVFLQTNINFASKFV